MPVRKVQGGYQWGTSGNVYPTREQAERQEQGNLASVEGEFQTATIFKNIGRGVKIVTGQGDFNIDFNNDYLIGQ